MLNVILLTERLICDVVLLFARRFRTKTNVSTALANVDHASMRVQPIEEEREERKKEASLPLFPPLSVEHLTVQDLMTL